MNLKTSTKLALATIVCKLLLFVRRVVGLGADTEVTRDGIRWRLDLTEGVDLAIYLFGRFESSTVHVFRRLIPPGAIVIDIGANIGANTLELARCVGPTGRVIAFEPTRYAVERLAANLEANPKLAVRVSVEHAFLDDGAPRNGELDAFYSRWPLADGSGTRVHERHRGQLETAAGAAHYRLDDYVLEKRLDAIAFIKLDVDGHERAVLEGARKTLAWAPPIVMELAPYVLDEQAGAFEAILDILADAGYTLTEIPSGERLPHSAEALRARIPDGASMNVLAITKSVDREARDGSV